MKSLISFIKSKKRYLLIALSIGGIIFTGQHLLSEDTSSDAQQESITVTVERGAISQTVSASGQIETANYLGVTTSVNGIVKDVFVKEGDTVTKGQPIMVITLNADGEENLASAWGSYLSAKNSLESATDSLSSLESALITAKEAFQDEKESNSYQTHDERTSYTLAENTVETAQANYDNKLDEINQKQVALNKAWLTYQAQSPTIVAPSSGIVANIVVVEGMDITNSLSERTSSTVASIKNEGTPIATLNISEVDINKVKVGQKVGVTLNSNSDELFMATVVGIDKIGSTSSGVSNYPVIVKFDEGSDLVLPNMGVDAEIIIQEKVDILYVPSSAISSVRGSTVVNVVDGVTVRPVEVETGISTNEYTEITSGVEQGTVIQIDTLPTTGFTSSSNDQEGSGGRPGLVPFSGGGRR
ncbi:MAG: efflux RND transporter periplasmic adaptor subunit [Patescibacteria group bacterium]